ncbi:branched-chain amino acid ABC transporter permease [Cellulomonas sp. APG4]|nr:branched-chain amino acid ABC transporter permease [Cellulomonas sp. APG4]
MPRTRTSAFRPPPRRGLRGLVLAAVGLLTVLVTAAPAGATTQECTPGAENGCIGGTLRTSAGEPAVGVALEATGPGETAETTSGDDGRWSISVSEPGDWTVTLDEATLPDGETLRDPAANPRTVTVTLGSTSAALFPLGEPAPAAPADEPTSDVDAGGDAAPGAGGDEPGLDTAVPGSASGGGFTWARFAQQATAGLVFGTLLALASVGLSLIFGTTGLSNFSHGELVTLGGISAYVFTQVVGLPLVVSAVLAVVVGGAAGLLQDVGIWRPLRRRRIGLTQQLIVTIGLAITMQYLYQFFLGGNSLRIVRTNPSTVNLGSVFITQQSLWSLLIGVVVLGGVSYFLIATRTGRATRAVSDNPALAAASGIDVDRIIRLVWVAGAALAALGGVLMGLYLNATAWNMGTTLLLLMFAAVTLGGLGTAFGALAGSIVIGLVVELSNLVIPSDMRYAGALVILILVLLLRPQGILGRAERVG